LVPPHSILPLPQGVFIILEPFDTDLRVSPYSPPTHWPPSKHNLDGDLCFHWQQVVTNTQGKKKSPHKDCSRNEQLHHATPHLHTNTPCHASQTLWIFRFKQKIKKQNLKKKEVKSEKVGLFWFWFVVFYCLLLWPLFIDWLFVSFFSPLLSLPSASYSSTAQKGTRSATIISHKEGTFVVHGQQF
jgi:hypothetical protein